MDESALNYNIPPSTIVQKVGGKAIFIKKQLQEKSIISVILFIWGNRDKLLLYIIFKSAKNLSIYKRSLKTELVKKINIIYLVLVMLYLIKKY